MSANEATHPAGSLREHRVAAGLSQQALATLAGCSVAMVRLLERGYEPEGSAVRRRVVAALNDVAPAAAGATWEASVSALDQTERSLAGGQTPPHDLDAEAATLGAILLTGQALSAVRRTGLAADHFYRPRHHAIYAAMVARATLVAVADDPLFEQWARRVRARLLWARWSALGGAAGTGGDRFCAEVERAAELPDPVERLVTLLGIADRAAIAVWLSPSIAAALDAAGYPTRGGSR